MSCGLEGRVYTTHFVWKDFELINKCKIRFLDGDTPGAPRRKNNPYTQTIKELSQIKQVPNAIRTESEITKHTCTLSIMNGSVGRTNSKMRAPIN